MWRRGILYTFSRRLLMSRMVLDAELIAKFRGLTKSVEIADESGNVIGSFVPNEAFDRIMTFLLPPATKEEIAEARAEVLATGTLKDGVSTAEILAAIDNARRRCEATQ
jgi:hypothetical protein